jgi:hypothetical protein
MQNWSSSTILIVDYLEIIISLEITHKSLSKIRFRNVRDLKFYPKSSTIYTWYLSYYDIECIYNHNQLYFFLIVTSSIQKNGWRCIRIINLLIMDFHSIKKNQKKIIERAHIVVNLLHCRLLFTKGEAGFSRIRGALVLVIQRDQERCHRNIHLL